MDHPTNGASMAIAFAHVSIHTRAKGHSAIAASSYRSGTKIYDARTGISYDFSNRHDVVFSTLLLPQDASSEFSNREFLWNQVELAEKRKDAQLCKDVVLALPKELDLTLQIELTKQFAQTYFVDDGLAADIAIHDHGDGNPHAHILIPTRRLEKHRFSKYKARDLNPVFHNKFIVKKEYWGEQWRSFQNAFFMAHGLDVSVDFNHIISERHTGRKKDQRVSYLQEENQLIHAARAALALNSETFIEQISETHSVFTRRDIERLVFKTFKNTDHRIDSSQIVAKILEHQEVIQLGCNERGIESYTTRQQYRNEGKLLEHVERLNNRKTHVLYQNFGNEIAQYQLNEEQTEALRFVSQGRDISVLIGRPGVGKSYLLKPLKECYESSGYIVLGASLSGKVAKTLEVETGISVSTIASLTYRLKTEKLCLTKNHVLIIDEAGMVDFTNLAYLLKTVKEAGAKIILVGDPDQLKPIHKGEIFRGIAARTGYFELGNIRRQQDDGDRKASLALAQGQIKDAVKHYAKKDAIQFFDGYEETANVMVQTWQKDLTATSMKQHVMLAFTCAAVETLNTKGREVAIGKGLVMEGGFEYYSKNSSTKILLSNGERILFRQNNKALGVRNGDLATVSDINAHAFTAILDSGEKVAIPKNYPSIDYGYALTIHKSQGMTVKHASVFIDSTYWDRHLSFVALTRHKETLKIYANRDIHSDLNALTQTLSRSSTKDNVIDWPLDFAIRAGFDSGGLVEKTVHYISKVTTTIKNKWNYIVNYEAFLYAQDIKEKSTEQRSIAHSIAHLMDEAEDLKQQFKRLDKEAKQKNLNPYQLPNFEALYLRSLARDKKAAELLATHRESMKKITLAPNMLSRIKSYSERYVRYQTIESLVKSSSNKSVPLPPREEILKIDLKKDLPHIIQLATHYHLHPETLGQKIQAIQQQHKKYRRANVYKDTCSIDE
jgi:Ti-type conjugative transfer relaxase TraA